MDSGEWILIWQTSSRPTLALCRSFQGSFWRRTLTFPARLGTGSCSEEDSFLLAWPVSSRSWVGKSWAEGCPDCTKGNWKWHVCETIMDGKSLMITYNLVDIVVLSVSEEINFCSRKISPTFSFLLKVCLFVLKLLASALLTKSEANFQTSNWLQSHVIGLFLYSFCKIVFSFYKNFKWFCLPVAFGIFWWQKCHDSFVWRGLT